MYRILLLVSLGCSFLTPQFGYADSEKCLAGVVLQDFFNLIQSGQGDEAEKLVLIQTPDQERAVKEFIKTGITFFSRERITNTVLETFESGPYAVCAIVQTSSNKPDMHEIEKAFLMLDGENWRLLAQPQDHRSKLNNLTVEELAAFDPLDKRFHEFKARNKELRTPAEDQ